MLLPQNVSLVLQQNRCAGPVTLMILQTVKNAIMGFTLQKKIACHVQTILLIVKSAQMGDCLECELGYSLGSTECLYCSSGCVQCTIEGCIECQSGSCLTNGVCFIETPSLYTADNGICVVTLDHIEWDFDIPYGVVSSGNGFDFVTSGQTYLINDLTGDPTAVPGRGMYFTAEENMEI